MTEKSRILWIHNTGIYELQIFSGNMCMPFLVVEHIELKDLEDTEQLVDVDSVDVVDERIELRGLQYCNKPVPLA